MRGRMTSVSAQDVLKRVDGEKTIKRTMDLANVESPTGAEKDVAFLKILLVFLPF